MLYYIGPQVWAWRQYRVRQIAARVDAMAVVFPFEVALYQSSQVTVSFVGHPLLDIANPTRARETTLGELELDTAMFTTNAEDGLHALEIASKISEQL